MRSLKPENVLIDRFGYLKITDFGLSKRFSNNQKNTSICGTPEYLAPEVLLRVGHGKPVDWWTLGCMIYELLTGLPPFYSEDRKKLFDSIKQCDYPKLPSTVIATNECKDLISRLLQKDPALRLGANGAQEIKQHPFFVNVNWEHLLTRSVKAPFVPKVKDATDTSNIDPEFTNMQFESYGANSLENTTSTAVYTGMLSGWSPLSQMMLIVLPNLPLLGFSYTGDMNQIWGGVMLCKQPSSFGGRWCCMSTWVSLPSERAFLEVLWLLL